MATELAPRGHSLRVGRREAVLAVFCAAAAGLIAYVVAEVPVRAPLPGGHFLLFCPLAPLPLPRGQISAHWLPAIGGALIVTAFDTVVVAVARRRARPAPPQSPDATPASAALRLERVPIRAVAIAGAASLTLFAAGLTEGYPMWVFVGLAILPWIPLVAVEAVWKYEHYGLWAIFGVAVLLQIGHMGEHTVQVSELLLYNGRLAQSHGVFGQLDFETVHFIWDSAVWVLLCLVLIRFSRGNRWLWVAFLAASLHEIEHLYLFWIYQTDRWFYTHAGLAGIMGNGGLIGSPLARPYLHFAYNFIVVVPMVCAFLDETKHVRRRTRTVPLRSLEARPTAA